MATVEVGEKEKLGKPGVDRVQCLVVTPERLIRTGARRGMASIRWEELTDEKVAAIPVLARLRGST